MAKKLVFDRTLWIAQKTKARVVVPNDEMWKVGLNRCSNDGFYVSNSYFESAYSSGRHLGGGATIEMPASSVLTGIAFKVVEQ